jgi:hypothetical protein
METVFVRKLPAFQIWAGSGRFWIRPALAERQLEPVKAKIIGRRRRPFRNPGRLSAPRFAAGN